MEMEIKSMGAIASDCACSRRVSSTAAMPLRRSCTRERFSSIRFIWLELLEVDALLDEVAILSQFADEWIDLPQRESSLWTALQITAHEAILRGRAGSSAAAQASSEAALPYFLTSTKNALDATHPEVRPGEAHHVWRPRQRRCWLLPCAHVPAVEVTAAEYDAGDPHRGYPDARPRLVLRCSRSNSPVRGSSRRTNIESHCTSTVRPIQPGGAP